eukprot:gnl/TRDRNA2_/TRDRNA2_190143_c0_seq1.p1 gnl/TRDRNA2_/TRDRNA2_190143_c0~~gnl/TRDRNA2_/TRDRNA2_190143_c0_seq1.p1  ORF type:complete len:193 (-),score=36.92 gnl/TRDRNA2_/TRDRNA2_190143_c0_seq1:113-622(-)
MGEQRQMGNPLLFSLLETSSGNNLADLDGPVTVFVDGDVSKEVEVLIDPERGPLVCKINGTLGANSQKINHPSLTGPFSSAPIFKPKKWSEYTASEKRVFLTVTAKKNWQMKNFKGADFWEKAELYEWKLYEDREQRRKEFAAESSPVAVDGGKDFNEELNGDESGDMS